MVIIYISIEIIDVMQEEIYLQLVKISDDVNLFIKMNIMIDLNYDEYYCIYRCIYRIIFM